MNEKKVEQEQMLVHWNNSNVVLHDKTLKEFQDKLYDAVSLIQDAVSLLCDDSVYGDEDQTEREAICLHKICLEILRHAKAEWIGGAK